MQITLTTPAVLFPAISLLLLAYTNRFLALAALIRTLHSNYKVSKEDIILAQIKNLRKRVVLIKQMQFYGVVSLFFCVFSMFLLFAGKVFFAEVLFGISLVLLMLSLTLSVREIQISVKALDIHLVDLEKDVKNTN